MLEVPAGAQVLAVEANRVNDDFLFYNKNGAKLSDETWMYSSIHQEGWNGIHVTAEPPLWQTANQIDAKWYTGVPVSVGILYFRRVLGMGLLL